MSDKIFVVIIGIVSVVTFYTGRVGYHHLVGDYAIEQSAAKVARQLASVSPKI